jgi:hypothetical protein
MNLCKNQALGWRGELKSMLWRGVRSWEAAAMNEGVREYKYPTLLK